MKTIDNDLYNALRKALSVQTETGWTNPDYDDIEEVISIVCDHYGVSDGDSFNFEKVSKMLMTYLLKNYHPHTKIIITSTECEVVEGIKSVVNDNYNKDNMEYLESLFSTFINSRSDACSLETSDSERTDLEWREFIRTIKANQL